MKDDALQKLLLKDPDRGMSKLIEKYGGLVAAVISGRLRSQAFTKEDIEDCAAETFFEFWRGFESSPCSGCEIRARLCMTAKRNALDRLRKAYRQPETVALDSDGAPELRDEASVEGGFESKESRLALIGAVKALGKPDSDIIIRKYYLGQSSRQIAEAMGLSVSNVDTRTHRAVKKLREILGGSIDG